MGRKFDLRAGMYTANCTRCAYRCAMYLENDISNVLPLDRVAAHHCIRCGHDFVVSACELQSEALKTCDKDPEGPQPGPTPPFTKFRGYRTPYNVAFRNQV